MKYVREAVVGSMCLALGAQQAPLVSPEFRVPPGFVSLIGRHDAKPSRDAWLEHGVVHVQDLTGPKVLQMTPEGFAPAALRPDAPLPGQVKYRNQRWWNLRREPPSPTGKATLEVYDPEAKRWYTVWRIRGDVADFEMDWDGTFHLFGVRDAEEGWYHLRGTISEGGSLNLGEDPPYPRKGDGLPGGLGPLLWGTCQTSRSDQGIYAYFPHAGRLYYYDLTEHSLREYKEPWPSFRKEDMLKQIEQSKQPVLVTTGHPGYGQSYFVPMLDGQMIFVYKVADWEMTKGHDAVKERVSAVMLSPHDPLPSEVNVPDRTIMGTWIWDSLSQTLKPLSSLMKKPAPLTSDPKTEKGKGKGSKTTSGKSTHTPDPEEGTKAAPKSDVPTSVPPPK